MNIESASREELLCELARRYDTFIFSGLEKKRISGEWLYFGSHVTSIGLATQLLQDISSKTTKEEK